MQPRVILQPRRAGPFLGRHPWVYAGAIARVEGDPSDGAEVNLVGHAGTFIARGLYNSQSKIRVRLYRWTEGPLDEGFFRDRLQAAVQLRTVLGLIGPGQACRMVFSEGDGISGLTVDAYDRWLAVQFTSLALAQRREMIARLLQELLQPAGIYLRTERGIGQLEGLELQDGLLVGELPPAGLQIVEHGLTLRVNLAEGQKTGYYLDQRDNRVAVARLAKGRRMLDAFCYTGGFALHAGRAGAREVIAVDSSEAALSLAQEHARENGLGTITFHKADVFVDLEQRVRAGEQFGLIVLDPPKFARQRGAVEDALAGYRRLQALSLQLLEPGGFLVTCSCSGLITAEMLEGTLAGMATENRREVQLLERRGAAPDHPVALNCLESAYLTCVIAYVR